MGELHCELRMKVNMGGTQKIEPPNLTLPNVSFIQWTIELSKFSKFRLLYPQTNKQSKCIALVRLLSSSNTVNIN